MKQLGKALWPKDAPKPITLDLKEIGFSLKCLRELEELARNQRLAAWRCRNIIFD
jgi:hypothetical protein